MGLITESLYPMTNLSLSYPCPPNKPPATTFLLSGFFSKEYLFIWLHWVLSRHTGSSIFTEARGIYSFSMQTLSGGMWSLVPWPGIKPGPPVLGVLATQPPGKSLLSDCYILAIMNTVAMNTEYRYLFEIMVSFSSDIYPEVGFMDHMVVLVSISWGISILFSTVVVPVYIPTNTIQGFSFATSSSAFVISCPLGYSHTNRWETISHCSFD